MHARFIGMGQKIDPDELREMLKVAARLRASALETDDLEYMKLFLRGAIALEERAALLAYHPADLDMDEPLEEEIDPALYHHVDLHC